MKTQDIIQLIEACSKHKVVELTFEGVNVVFNKGPSEPAKLQDFGPTPSAAIPKSEDDERDQVAELLITDPLEMEKRIADGELVDVEED